MSGPRLVTFPAPARPSIPEETAPRVNRYRAKRARRLWLRRTVALLGWCFVGAAVIAAVVGFLAGMLEG